MTNGEYAEKYVAYMADGHTPPVALSQLIWELTQEVQEKMGGRELSSTQLTDLVRETNNKYNAIANRIRHSSPDDPFLARIFMPDAFVRFITFQKDKENKDG